jgi:inosine-uridine nucleoside N-ribohydrolase
MATHIWHRGSWRLADWTLPIILLAASCIAAPSPAAAESPDGRCIIIDSDAALDDFRAVATLAHTRRVAAIVVTEGLAKPIEGAGAMETLLSRGGLSIPVIPGASPNPDRRYAPDPRLEEWRDNAERLNRILPTPIAPSTQPPGDIAATLRRYTAKCSTISLLVIGPWTSFMRYAAEILERVDRIIAQGRPYPDEPGGEPAGFNCVYDLDSCYAAFDLLVGRQQRTDRKLRADWIDIPNSPELCGSAEPGIDAQGKPLYAFRPVEAWSRDLEQAGGMAQTVAEVLSANPSGWEQTSLWDDLAALYLLRPDIFVVRGGHLEPCVPAATVRNLLAGYMAKSVP